jgi:ribulose-phosphate 3-epimerase
MGPPLIKAFRKHSKLPFDVHLMIVEPEKYLQDFRDAGADIITVHAETSPHLHRTLDAIRQLGCKAGVSLNPSTPVSAVEEVLDMLDLILVMSVNPGFGGQSFIPSSIEKIRKLRTLINNRPIHLEVDGGVAPGNATMIREAGADVLVAGSAVFGAPDRALAIAQLKGTAPYEAANNASMSSSTVSGGGC